MATSEKNIHFKRQSVLGIELKKYLGEIIFAGNDGIVTTFSVVSGFSGAAIFDSNSLKLSIGVVILFGFANLFSDGFSMGMGNYLSKRAEVDVGTIVESKTRIVKNKYCNFYCICSLRNTPSYSILVRDFSPYLCFCLLSCNNNNCFGIVRNS